MLSQDVNLKALFLKCYDLFSSAVYLGLNFGISKYKFVQINFYAGSNWVGFGSVDHGLDRATANCVSGSSFSSFFHHYSEGGCLLPLSIFIEAEGYNKGSLTAVYWAQGSNHAAPGEG